MDNTRLTIACEENREGGQEMNHKIKEVIKMPQQIKVQCPKCGNISYLTSKGDKDEVIEFICPNCGKHELLVAYDLNLGHTDGKRK